MVSSNVSRVKMSREIRTSRRRSTEIGESLQQNDSQDEASSQHARNDSYVIERGNIPEEKRWTTSEESSKSYNREITTNLSRDQGDIEDTELESTDVKSNDKSRRSEEHVRGKGRRSNIHGASEDKISSKSLEGGRRKRSKRVERRRLGERPRTADRNRHDRIDAGSSMKRHNGEDTFADKPRRKIKEAAPADDKTPITEILKKVQENIRTKYEEPTPLPELTTDTIYIQGRNGFSAVKIGGLRRPLGNDAKSRIEGRENRDFTEVQAHMLIRVAVVAQKFWKCTGLVYQGLLGGMALLHFVMIQVFFNISTEFVLNYSIFSEIYTSSFSFLITLCVISIFDKFDLARFDMDHLREIFAHHTKTVIAVPLYLATFGLHQTTSDFDEQIALIHYHGINETTWSNDTTFESFQEELKHWQRITMSKDLLAVLAWLFVSLGTRDNMFSMHLESMEKYASDVESPT